MTEIVWREYIRGYWHECALTSEGEAGWRLTYVKHGILLASRLFVLRADALVFADELKAETEKDQ